VIAHESDSRYYTTSARTSIERFDVAANVHTLSPELVLVDPQLAVSARRYRASKLVGAITTWAIALVLIGDARLYDPSTWSH
jgi:hypothetical protein